MNFFLYSFIYIQMNDYEKTHTECEWYILGTLHQI